MPKQVHGLDVQGSGGRPLRTTEVGTHCDVTPSVFGQISRSSTLHAMRSGPIKCWNVLEFEKSFGKDFGNEKRYEN